MTFEEFQDRARLYVLGALDSAEMKEVKKATKAFGQKAENFIQECYALRETLALRLRPARSSALLKEGLMSMVRQRDQRSSRSHGHAFVPRVVSRINSSDIALARSKSGTALP
jgi:hypothetical protein